MKYRLTALFTGFCVTATALCLSFASFKTTAAEEKTIRILAMGDSITHGYINGDNGYRKYLCYNLQQEGFTNFDMVGPNNSWTDTATYDYNGTTITYDPAHAGYSGYAIQEMTTMEHRSGLRETIFDNNYYSSDGSAGNMLEVYDPNIILLQIGTNDVLSAYNDGITERLEGLIDAILPYLDEENDVLFVSTIPDVDAIERHDWLGAYETIYGLSYQTDQEAFAAKVQECIDTYNSSIYTLVTKKQAEGEKIRFADIHSVVDMETGLYDGVHPNEDGYACMGKYWADQILTYLNGAIETPTETTTETTTITEETTTTVETTTTTEETTTSATEMTTGITTGESTSAQNTEETALTTSVPEVIQGDVNLDGTVKIADAVLLCRYLLGESTLTQPAFEQADMNQDDIVNGLDLVSLRQTLLTMGGFSV